MYCVIFFEESDYVLEKLVFKGLLFLYIIEELLLQRIYEENVLNEKLVIEIVWVCYEVGEFLEIEISFVIFEFLLKMVVEFFDFDYYVGVEEDDDLSEKDFLEEFEVLEGVFECEIFLVSLKEFVFVVVEKVNSCF